MILFEIIFIGILRFLEATIYKNEDKETSFVFKHSLLITTLSIAINIQSILGLTLAYFLQLKLDFFLFIGLIIIFSLFVYIRIYKTGRAERIAKKDQTIQVKLIYSLVSLIYIILTVYLMIEAGNIIRSKYSILKPMW